MTKNCPGNKEMLTFSSNCVNKSLPLLIFFLLIPSKAIHLVQFLLHREKSFTAECVGVKLNQTSLQCLSNVLHVYLQNAFRTRTMGVIACVFTLKLSWFSPFFTRHGPKWLKSGERMPFEKGESKS